MIENSGAIFSEDRKTLVWFHDGIHGTKGFVTLEGEWDAVIVGVTPDGRNFSVGKRRFFRKFRVVQTASGPALT